jgi:threonine/homoserine/homoserine lactone efflux protein
MAIEVFTALLVFTVVAAFTPGPNNLMLLSSGVNFGFRRTLPHMIGVCAGFLVLTLAVGCGLGAVMENAPTLYTALKVLGGAYLVYLAWRIAFSRTLGRAEARTRPLSAMEAAAFQWVNPKGWVMAVAGVAAYTNPQDYLATLVIVCTVFTLVSLSSVSVWTAFGSGVRAWLADPARLRRFNIAMGVALVLSLWPMLR